MQNELSRALMCVQMRSGVEIWLEQEKAMKLQHSLQGITSSKFVFMPDNQETVNTADIVGIFTAKTMADFTRRKNGEWQCKRGTWHERRTECACRDEVPEWQPEPTPAEPMDEEARKRGEAKLAEMRGRVGKSM